MKKKARFSRLELDMEEFTKYKLFSFISPAVRYAALFEFQIISAAFFRGGR